MPFEYLDVLDVQVKDMQDFRRSLPDKTRLIVCKNTLLKQAVDKAPNSAFSELGQAAQARFGPTDCSSCTRLPFCRPGGHDGDVVGVMHVAPVRRWTEQLCLACRATTRGCSWARR